MSDLITLKWCEPFNGWESNDTGLCNRILHWEIAYDIIEKYKDLNISIELEKRHWPEHRLLYFPDTNFSSNVKFKHNNQYKVEFTTVYDYVKDEVRKASPITKEMVTNYRNTREIDLSSDNFWYSDFGFKTLLKREKFLFDKESRGLKKIELVHKKFEQQLKHFAKDTVGIHIRRGNGVNITEDDILSLPQNIQNRYREDVKNFTLDIYGFIKDDVYFNIIDEILKINPKQKFYISHDQPYDYMVHYKEKYGKNVVFKEDIMPHVKNYFRNIGLDTDELNEGHALDNVVDLFSLTFSKMIIKSNISTWSHFACTYYDSTPYFDANVNINTILKLYKFRVYKAPMI